MTALLQGHNHNYQRHERNGLVYLTSGGAGVSVRRVLRGNVPDDTVDTLSARILKEEHRIYSEAIRLVLSGNFRIEGRRVILGR